MGISITICGAEKSKSIKESADIRGIYVVTLPFSLKNGSFIKAVDVNGVDGVLIQMDWSEMTSNPGVYGWKSLDSIINEAVNTTTPFS